MNDEITENAAILPKIDILSIKENITKNINGYINSVEPCGICRKKGDQRSTDCFDCCFYYASKFEPA